jgi:hypothetical protein
LHITVINYFKLIQKHTGLSARKESNQWQDNFHWLKQEI